MNTRSVRLSCWVEPEIERKLRALAERDERSISSFLRLALREVAMNSQAVTNSDNRLQRITDAARAIGRKS